MTDWSETCQIALKALSTFQANMALATDTERGHQHARAAAEAYQTLSDAVAALKVWTAAGGASRPIIEDFATLTAIQINYAAPWLLDTLEKVNEANRIWTELPMLDIQRDAPWKLGDNCWYAPA